MKYKGYELLKAIADGKIKEGSRFKAGYRTFIARDGYLFVEYDNRQEYANSFELNWDFELIEDKINIENMKYGTNQNKGIITKSSSDNEKEKELRNYIVNNMEDIDKLIQAVKQIKKEVKELKEDK